MLDRKAFRNSLSSVVSRLARRGLCLDVPHIEALEAQRKRLQTEFESLSARHNHHSRELAAYQATGHDAETLRKALRLAKHEMEALRKALNTVQDELDTLLATTPNLPHESVPDGVAEEDNQCLRRWQEPRKMDFPPRDHVALGEALGGLDFPAAARVAGARFAVLRGPLARLHRALGQLMLDTHTREHGYTELNVPCLVQAHSCFGTGQLPKFADDLFHVQKQDLYLSPTAEVPVTNLMREQILDSDCLPLRYVCHSLCFRSEAGSHGKDVRGLIRQHQFEKVELVQLSSADESWSLLETLTGHAERILQDLGLPYRVMALCAADLGFAAAKTYDLEVWLPGQGRYREISSCSNFTDFQARRMRIRWRNPARGGKTELVHTLNGSGLAIGRTLVAVLENFQDEAGRIILPEVLHPYMDGITVLEPEAR